MLPGRLSMHAHLEGDPGADPELLEGLYIPPDLGTPWNPPGETGNCGMRGGSLG